MQTAHIISDLVLSFTGFYVFFRHLVKLELSSTILWESFVLSIAASALFGAIRFAGFSQSAAASSFFQNLASITGGLGVAMASFALVTNKSLSKLTCYIVLAIGFLLFALSEGFGFHQINAILPIISMVLIVVFGIIGLFGRNKKSGIWLIIGVLFFALGTFRKQIFGEGDFNIDVFHFLTAGGLLSFGTAVSHASK
jgi:hypothetical protein